jgi:hypothetical protein
MWSNEYVNYLKSSHWKKLSRQKLNQVGKCETCGSINNLEVHHKRYKKLFDIELSDLMVLCRKCHLIRHGKCSEARKPQANWSLDAYLSWKHDQRPYLGPLKV